jgi:hypothetical protein
MRNFKLLFLFLIIGVNSFAQVNSYPETSSGACDGYAQLSGNYINATWYSETDTINPIPPDSLNSFIVYGLCVGNYYVNALDSLGNNRFYFSITTANPCQNFAVSIQTIPTTDSLVCYGKAFAITENGQAPFTYSWTNNSTTDSATGLCVGIYLLTVTDNNGCVFNGQANIGVNPCLNFSSGYNAFSSQSNINCNGAASVWPINGKAPFTYSWSNSATSSQISGLCPGTYQVTITDSLGCNAFQSIDIFLDSLNGGPCSNFNLNISVIPTTDTLNCNGSIYSNTSGGTLPNTYSWSSGDTTNNIFNKCIGQYTLTVTDANGCVKTLTDFITFAPDSNPCSNFSIYAASINNASDTNTCNGSIILGINNGLAPIVYNWSTGNTPNDSSNAFNLCYGNYTVIATDANNCSFNLPFNIPIANNPCQNFQITLNTNSITDTINCNGFIEVNISNGYHPISVLWNDNSTNNNILGICNEGYYSVTVTDSIGCSLTDSAFVGRDSLNPACANLSFNVNFVDASQNICNGSASSSLTGGSGQYGYSWSTGDTLPNISNLCPGSYTAYSIDMINNCIKTFSFGIANTNNCQNPPNVTITGPTQIIAGESATLTASGANIYNWNTGDSLATISVSPQATTTYSVTGTDSLGCSGSATWTLTVGADPCSGYTATVTATNTSHLTCNGTITVTSNSSNPLNYSWSDSLLTGSNLIGLCAGTYAVSVTDLSTGCSVSSTATVGVDSSANPCLGFQVVIDNTTNETAPSAGDGQIYASTYGGTAPFLYNWGNGLASDTAYFSGMYGGAFTLTVSDANGCSAFANGFVGTTAPSSGPCAGVLIDVALSTP